MTCPVCHKALKQTSPVNALFFWIRGATKPYRLWSDEDYTVCSHADDGCDSVLRFLARAIDSHAEARSKVGDSWHKARIVFDDGDSWLIRSQGPEPVVARA